MSELWEKLQGAREDLKLAIADWQREKAGRIKAEKDVAALRARLTGEEQVVANNAKLRAEVVKLRGQLESSRVQLGDGSSSFSGTALLEAARMAFEALRQVRPISGHKDFTDEVDAARLALSAVLGEGK